MPSISSERATVQNPLVEYVQEIGWAYVSPDQALTLRRGESGTLFYQTLRDKLISLNPGVVTVANADEIVARIESVRNNIEGNAEVLAWLRGERSVYVESEKRQRNVALIDFEHPAENVFQVTGEWQYTNGKFRNRADVVFVINGIPVALVETKSAVKKEGIEEGITQIRRYHRETPELVTAPQIFDVTHLIDFYYGVTWNLDRKSLFNWKDEEKGNFERKVKRFFARERFLRFLESWIIFYKKDDELRKIVLRQHQTRAVEKVVERALDPEKRTGLVWHTQGSGKTFTMIKAADLILRHPAFEKPTVILLVDRNELESQLFANLAAYGLAPEIARSKQHLRELLRSDYRGLIVSMIHKFDKADADLCTRENVFVLVDEAHRTTSGDLGNYLVAAVPNATMIGFTGTPIDRIAYGKGTFKVFGKDDEKGYLDKYSIAESIEDGTTLPLNYTLAPNDIRVPREQLEKEFLDLAEAQGISDIEELNKILDRAVNLKTFLKAEDRVDKVARFVAQHFRENVEPSGYKAFLVAVDRQACALYKKALDKYLPPEYSTVVYTSAHNDDEILAQYKLSEDEEKQVRRAFIKRDSVPKILIVTEKLLTGFDAPVLYCMYLDKPMRDHTLLQAIARVNRPYEDEDGIKKPAGYVLDFVGIFEKLESALAFDSDVVGSAIQNIDVLKTRFVVLMEQSRRFLELCAGPIDDKAVERAIEVFEDKERRESFYKLFQELETLYEIISPDVFLRPYIEDYGKLSALYQIVVNAFSKKVALIRDLMKKTEDLVKRTAIGTGLDTVMKPVRIDENTLKALKSSDGGEPPKVINLGKSLLATVREEGEQQPFLIPISERTEAILEAYDDRQLSTQSALEQLARLMEEYLQAKREREKTGFDINTFTLFWLLKQAGAPDPGGLAPKVEAAFRKYPNYRENVAEERQLKAELYKLVLPAVGKEAMVTVVKRMLELPRS
ncbi:MAG TPA: HsdR family type I site-specific deoxyribonuclease [Bryobacteraceae bacterium]|nr:HsdR family type I site-specific deoxyribonuclease [Bryobacteraceae bacterium]HOL72102.1 HsdR family type I site-specific deoxyribonuclease [Bryobacteraceae bacterium]HPQ15183.1 HsdR family type I site-specific deoxyribonuclease [Bryobacteraceae bacterium]